MSVNDIYLFHIRFQKPQESDELVEFLEGKGFNLLEQRGSKIGNMFRNFNFEKKSGNGTLQAYYNLLPGKDHVTLLQFNINISDGETVIPFAFDTLNAMFQNCPFDLIDTELKNKRYLLLMKEGKVDQHLIGLSKDEAKTIEQQCFIPLNSTIFLENKEQLQKRSYFKSGLPAATSFSSEKMKENKNPADMGSNVLDQLFKWIKK